MLSGPILWIINPNLPRPPMGALLDPVPCYVRLRIILCHKGVEIKREREKYIFS